MIQRFSTRLAILVVGLLATALLLAFVGIQWATDNQVERTVQRELDVSSRVFTELLDTRASQLQQAAQVLADDFGFRQAVGTGDKETIISALVNHGDRIGTDLMVLQDPSGAEIASTHAVNHLPSLTTMADAMAQETTQLAVIEGQVFQLVTVPVKAPKLIAWATLGFVVNDALASELQRLANADITLYLNQPAKLFASSLAEQPQQQLLQQLRQQSSVTAWQQQQQLAIEQRQLVTLDNNTINVLLSTSMASAKAEFSKLRWQIAVVAVSALLLAIALATWMARSVSEPIRRLSYAANRLREGDYEHAIRSERKDEFGELASTFDQMRVAVSEREKRISYQASHDLLTDLPNRREVIRVLTPRLASRQPSSLLIVNINRFRELNDRVGQKIGDQLLVLVAQRIQHWHQEQLPDQAWLARLGGDEFVILVDSDDQALVDSALENLMQRLQQPWLLDHTDYVMQFSAGAVAIPSDGDDIDSLLRRVQISRRIAVQEKHLWHWYMQGEDEQHMRQLAILQHLKDAVAEQQLNLVLQPKVDCVSGRAVGAEALLRWHHPVLGHVRPDEFIPLAEQSGEIGRLTRWVIVEAFSVLNKAENAGIDMKLSVNLSTVDLLSDTLPKLLSDYVDQFSANPSSLMLEITESAVMQDPENAIERLQQLKQRGFMVSIDDYGTGESSLAQLKRLPVDELKIDRSFVQHLPNDERDQIIVRSTIQLARELGLKTVAEGVEDDASWQLLQSMACAELQGYYFSKPLPIEEFFAWYQSH